MDKVMTIISTAGGDFTILSSGSVALYAEQIAFLQNALKYLEEKQSNCRKESEDLSDLSFF